jgi:hypothetical protein
VCSVLSRFQQILLLNSELAISAIGNQRIRNITKRALNRLLVRQQHLLVLCLGQSKVGLEPPSFEDRLCERASQVPGARRTGKEVGKGRTLVTGSSGERNLRKESCLRDTDLLIRSNQILLRLPNIGPPLEQRRREPGWNFRGMWLLGQLKSARNITEGDFRDSPGISKSKAFDITDAEINMTIPWNNKYISEFGNGVRVQSTLPYSFPKTYQLIRSIA